jgi:hypothetical protein
MEIIRPSSNFMWFPFSVQFPFCLIMTLFAFISLWLNGWVSIWNSNVLTLIPEPLFSCYTTTFRGSAVGVATGYGLDDWGVGVRLPVRSRIFTFLFSPDRLWGPSCLLSNWPGVPSPEEKRKEREANYSPPTSAEIKKTWICTSTPTYNFIDLN